MSFAHEITIFDMTVIESIQRQEVLTFTTKPCDVTRVGIGFGGPIESLSFFGRFVCGGVVLGHEQRRLVWWTGVVEGLYTPEQSLVPGRVITPDRSDHSGDKANRVEGPFNAPQSVGGIWHSARTGT